MGTADDPTMGLESDTVAIHMEYFHQRYQKEWADLCKNNPIHTNRALRSRVNEFWNDRQMIVDRNITDPYILANNYYVGQTRTAMLSRILH